MRFHTSKIRSFSAWLFSALLFWIFLGCFEAVCTIASKVLQSRAIPAGKDFLYFITALSIYSLFSIPTALALSLAEKFFHRSVKRIKIPFPDLNPMDFYLFFGCALLLFRWISILLPYVVESDHLPKAPYLIIIPCIGIYIWSLNFFSKKSLSYIIQWSVLSVGAVFLSKQAYDIFIQASYSIIIKIALFIPLLAICVFSALLLYSILNRAIVNPHKFRPALTGTFVICLAGCFLLSLYVLSVRDYFFFLPSRPIMSHTLKPAAKKNVVLIVVDCLRTDHLASYGYSRTTSPFLDQLARSGITFTNCISSSSWTIPSVVSLFTGVYPQQHGVNSLGDIIPERLGSIQEIMVRNGMETAAFVTNDFLKPSYGYNRGFRYYVDKYLRQDFKDHIAANLFFLNAILYFKNELFFPFAVDPGGAKWWSIGIPPFNHKKISAETVTDDALEWMRIHRNMPFYMYIHYMDVHCPYDTYWYPLYDKGAYESQDTQAKLTNIYNGRIVYVDQQINRIWEALKQLGLIDKTMLIVTADHGEELYDHAGTGHCTTLYEELIRIPLIMHVPSFEGKHITLEHQVELTDIPVTVLDFLGLRIPQYMQGQSLLPLLANPSSKLGPSYAISHTTRGRKSLKTREGRELWNKRTWDQKVIMQSLRLNNEWKIIISDDGRAELFNLKRDKGEQSSVQASQQVISENLKKRLSEITSQLIIFTPKKEQKTLSPEMKNRLKALGYVS